MGENSDPLDVPTTSEFSSVYKLDSATSKAAKKALRRAKKEAQRRSQGLSPSHVNVNLAGYSPYRPTLPSPVNGSQIGGVSPRMSLGGLSPGHQQISGVSPGSSSRFSSPGHQMGSASPAYTLLCPSSQKLIIRKVKKK